MSLARLAKALFTPAPRLAPADCAGRVRGGKAVLVDVREPGEWTSGVAHSACLLPLSDLTGARTRWKAFLADVGEREILLYCASGARSGLAARLLTAEGLRATNTGGLSEWLDAGWPVAQPAAARASSR